MAPYLTLMDAAAPQRRHDPREVFNGLRSIVRSLTATTALAWQVFATTLID